MSADLLRRAATRLRESALAATNGDPWAAGADLFYGAHEVCIGGHRPLIELSADDEGSATADYIALVHPPVALALAEWLESHASHRDEGHPVVMHCASKVARAVLREPEGGEMP